MSGELEPELVVNEGDEILVFDPNQRRYDKDRKLLPPEPWTEKVTKVARVWITTERRRFRLDRQTEGLDYGHGGRFFRTRDQQAYVEKVRAAWVVLNDNGLTGAGRGFGTLHDEDLFAVAKLLGNGSKFWSE